MWHISHTHMHIPHSSLLASWSFISVFLVSGELQIWNPVSASASIPAILTRWSVLNPHTILETREVAPGTRHPHQSTGSLPFLPPRLCPAGLPEGSCQGGYKNRASSGFLVAMSDLGRQDFQAALRAIRGYLPRPYRTEQAQSWPE